MKVSLWVTIFLSQTEIDDIDLVSTLANAHEEVVGLDIAVDKGLGVDVLDAGDKLIGEEKNGLQRELPVAEIEQILQTGTKKVQHHGVVVAFRAKPAHKGDADTTSKGLIDACFVFELRMLRLNGFELDGNLLTRDDISACIR